MFNYINPVHLVFLEKNDNFHSIKRLTLSIILFPSFHHLIFLCEYENECVTFSKISQEIIKQNQKPVVSSFFFFK